MDSNFNQEVNKDGGKRYLVKSKIGRYLGGRKKKYSQRDIGDSDKTAEIDGQSGGILMLVQIGKYQCDQKKLPNVYKSCPKMISLEK